MTELEIKEQMCEVGRRVYNKGMVAANDGNFSVKLNDHEFLCTPTGVSKGFMTPEFICKVDENANVLEANEGFRPSSEIKMHMRVYKERPDVKSVVHAHPMYATGFAIAGIPLNQPIMPEAVIALGEVPIAAYGTPSTMEIPDAVSKFLQSRQLGGPKELPQDEVRKLCNMREAYGLTGRHPGEAILKNNEKNEDISSDIVSEITKKVMEQLNLK